MLRRTTIRTAVSALAAVLLALQLFAPTASFAAAHTLRNVMAKAEPGKALKAKPVRDTVVTYRKCDHSEDPTGPLRTRDRHRAVAHTVPGEPARPLLGENPAAASEPERPSARHHRTSRSLAAHTPAALQVFRC
ncbi:uncharacterized protein SGFS_034130 [Streptomyces graminofaciens]|uniref:Secreted protein n=1 Tax=Streptomyces graminofaciens TaxID=68212 RepID=A0ABM7F881_9ACTN|nr:hypothetical protein [Streptomyces graminofaciens]BBC32119.1 uncharacterized protein SGFS_034130 [Streptomyces graminofaciens]